MWSLKRRLILSYALVAFISMFLISILANVFLEKQFKHYVTSAHERKSKDIVQSITEQYQGNGKWNQQVIENIGVDGLGNGLMVNLEDDKGNTIWDATEHNNGMCEAIISHLSSNMMGRYANWKGGLVKSQYPVTVNSKNVGTVTISYYGPFYYSDEDILFLKTLNRIFIAVGIVSLSLSLILGFIMAEGLSRPILKVISAAELISKGHYKEKIKEKSKVLELSKLIGSINNLAKALENQEVLRKRLTGDVAHELRTPLATLQSHMEAMIDGIWEPTTERIRSCHEETVRINRLVGDLEKLAQYESDNLLLDKSEFDMGGVVNNILMNFESVYKNKNIEVSFKREDCIIFGDKDKVSQVVVNLLSNALKYTPEGGKVDIIVQCERDNVIFSIKDSGRGISEEDLPYIFERFYRADKSRNRMTGGAGIGLTITKTIVDAHNGIILVDSELDKGTEFKIYFPRNSE